MTDEAVLRKAAEAIHSAEALLIGAGAGMGVDSGLPDFRGDEGFWKAYPAFRGRGLSFIDMANPDWFRGDPAQAWGFYGHRLNLYRETEPHEGFAILSEMARHVGQGAFVFTSNVDGHFQRAGFDPERVVECHGSIHHLQCSEPCSAEIWPADEAHLEIDLARCMAIGDLPKCPRCGRVARPNILMFGDAEWIPERTAVQTQRYRRWLREARGRRIVAVECGAGTAIPTVRSECVRHADTLIRINVREPDVPRGGIAVPLGALEALRRIREERDKLRS